MLKRIKRLMLTDKWVAWSLVFLCLLGSAMIFSVSMGTSDQMNELGSSTFYLTKNLLKQVLFVVVGIFAYYFGVMAFDQQKIKKYNKVLQILCLLFLLLPLGFSATDGAKAWIKFSIAGTQITIQPVEFAKLLSLIVIAGFADNIAKDRNVEHSLKWLLGFILAEIVIVIILQKDFGSGFILAGIVAISFLLITDRKFLKIRKYLLMLVLFGIVVLAIFISPLGESITEHIPFMQGYQIKRFTSMYDPFADQFGSGYHLVMSVIAIANGGIGGVGYGNSIQKYAHFPNTDTDYILPILMEELGLIGFCFLALLYGIIIYRLFKWAMKMESDAKRIILIGVGSYLFLHFLLNVGGVTGFVPMTGIPLLLISSGGSSTVATLLAVGVCQGIIADYKQK